VCGKSQTAIMRTVKFACQRMPVNRIKNAKSFIGEAFQE
jgi:hypothetical protein